MKYSTKLCQSLNAMRSLANPLDFAKIEELIGTADASVQTHADELVQTSNMIELSGASLFGKCGTLSLFFNKNAQGEVQELAIQFSALSPIGRDVENDIINFLVREPSTESLNFIKPGKTFFIGSLSHKRNSRNNRKIQELSKLSVSVKKDTNGKFCIVSTGEDNSSGESACIC